MADVFISYKRDNKDAVQRIVQGLRASGLSVWWDHDIAADAPWEATIERELEQAKVVLVAWSPAAVSSENVKAEARRARTQGKLIQVFVASCQPPLFFGERQGVELTGWNGDVGDSRFKAVAGAAKAVMAGKRPPEGVGYAPPRRSPAPVFIGAVLLAAVVVAAFNLDSVRAISCTTAGLWCEPIAVDEAGVRPPNAAKPDGQDGAENVPEQPTSAETSALPRLEANVEHRVEASSGAAIDFDTGQVSDRLDDGADFVLSGDATGFAIAPAGGQAVIGQSVSGRPTPAACGAELARPTISWQIPMANDAGEYQCFVTGDGREGAFVLQRIRSNAVALSFTLWD